LSDPTPGIGTPVLLRWHDERCGLPSGAVIVVVVVVVVVVIVVVAGACGGGGPEAKGEGGGQ
jgi:hypothetical protein